MHNAYLVSHSFVVSRLIFANSDFGLLMDSRRVELGVIISDYDEMNSVIVVSVRILHFISINPFVNNFSSQLLGRKTV